MVRSKNYGDCTYEEAERWLEIDGSTPARKLRGEEALEWINGLLSRYDWVTKGDIGAKDFKYILRRIYTLDCWNTVVRGWLFELSFQIILTSGR